MDNTEFAHAPASAGKGSFALRIRCDSMVDPAGGTMSFSPGDIIIVDPNREAMPGYPVIVKLADAPEAVFKMLEVYDGKRYLKPLNPIYPTAPMPADARIVGVVISRQVHTLTEAGKRSRVAA